MFRPLELFIGLRYTRAKRRDHFISFISVVSIVCITISVTALITVMSVMNGFDSELRTRILGMVAHATVSGVGGSLTDWPRAVEIAQRNPHVRGAAPYVEREAFLRGEAASQGAIIRGVLPGQEPKVSDIGQKMISGKLSSLTPGSWGIILGKDLALNLGVGVGDKVVVYAPEFNVTLVGVVPRIRRFTVVGIFEAGMQEYDSGLAVIDMQDAEKLYNMDGPSGVRLRLDDMFQAYSVARDLADELGQAYQVRTWMQDHANFFKAVAMEKLVMFVILSLVVLVAAINLLSMLMMLVIDKQSEIAILRTLGATPLSIMLTFMVQGMIIGIVGVGLGVTFGSLLSWKLPAIADWIQNVFHVQFLSPDVYYISDVPSRLLASDVGWVALVTLLFSFTMTLYPAWRASRTQPAQALRYE
jgi:lipoprotein-releasing system permease protein